MKYLTRIQKARRVVIPKNVYESEGLKEKDLVEVSLKMVKDGRTNTNRKSGTSKA